MKKAVCSGYYGFDNFGDDAVLKVLVDGFSKKYNLTVFSANPSKTSALYDVKSVYSFDYATVLSEIKKADVLISGGGSLLQDSTSLKSLLYYLLLIYFAILYRKEIIIFSQGMGPFKRWISRFLVKNALKNCSKITVRDYHSKELLESWGINSSLVCDPVFSIPVKNKTKNGKLGIQLRSSNIISEHFLDNLASVINKEFNDTTIILYSLQDNLDLNICKSFAEKLNSKNVIIKNNLTIDEVIDELSELEFLISMRFHAALIGLKAGVKVLPIAYDPKVEILARNSNIQYINPVDYKNLVNLVKQLKTIDTKQTQEFIKKQYFEFNVFDK